jgi:hypothetical protein
MKPRKFIIAAASVVILSGTAQAQHTICDPHERSEAIHAYCKSHNNPAPSIDHPRFYSCLADRNATDLATYKSQCGYSDAQVAAWQHYANEVDFLVEKAIVQMQYSPKNEWSMLFSLFVAELDRPMAELQETLRRATRR